MTGVRPGLDFFEAAIQYNDGYNEGIYSFVNNVSTHEGGSHVAGFRSALTRCINNFARAQKTHQGEPLGGRRKRRPRRSRQRQDTEPPVRGADEIEAGEQRDQGPRRERHEPAARRVLRYERGRGEGHRQQGHRRQKGAGGGQEGEGADKEQERLRGGHTAGKAGRLPGVRTPSSGSFT